MPLRTATILRWRNIVPAAALLAAGAGLTLLAPALRRDAATPVATEPGLPETRLDLRDEATRRQLRMIASWQRNQYADLAPPLFWRCGEGMNDVVAASFDFSFEPSYYVELRRGTGAEASALVWKNIGWGLPPPPPALTSQGYVIPRPTPAGTPRPRPLPDAELAAIIDEFVELSARGLAPLRGESALDGGTVLVEVCHHGRYGLFLRENPYDGDDARVMALAERVLAAAGIHERQRQYEAPPGPVAL